MKKLLKTVLSFNIFVLALPVFTLAQTYQPLTNITNSFDRYLPPGSPTTGFGLLISQIFTFFLVAAVVLAVVMIVFGGFQYMTSSDSGDKKSRAKSRITGAFWGLILALSTILILSTINPSLVSFTTNFPKLEAPKLPPPVMVNGVNLNTYRIDIDQLSEEQFEEYKRTGTISGREAPPALPNFAPNSTQNSANILATAQYFADNSVSTCDVSGTNGGRLACAWTVNEIVRTATGQPAGGGLSTANMQNALSTSDRFTFVGSDLSTALPGDIVISPTEGSGSSRRTGHVGIVETAGGGTIISNSSSRRQVERNFTANRWENLYEGNRNLNTYIYRPN